MSWLDVKGMERGVDALDRWMKTYRRSYRWMNKNRRPEPKTTNERILNSGVGTPRARPRTARAPPFTITRITIAREPLRPAR